MWRGPEIGSLEAARQRGLLVCLSLPHSPSPGAPEPRSPHQPVLQGPAVRKRMCARAHGGVGLEGGGFVTVCSPQQPDEHARGPKKKIERRGCHGSEWGHFGREGVASSVDLLNPRRRCDEVLCGACLLNETHTHSVYIYARSRAVRAMIRTGPGSLWLF